jgi:protein O-GlcNAc transferase
VWRDVVEQTDDELAEQIRSDQVDILVDLAGHTEGNRLLVFARKPAPIAASWIGYPGTTGLTAIDYLIADAEQVPAGAESDYGQRVLRLAGGYVAYAPAAEAPPVGPPPAAAKGAPTFGCFNNPLKINAPLAALWAEILRRCGGSTLLLKYGRFDNPLVQERVRGFFRSSGIDPARLEFLGHTARAEHLAAYGRVDVALDPLPYSGGVTTCDALWMGVPVVAGRGASFAGRHSLSHLQAAGLEELVARDGAEYVERAVRLASDLPRLAALRAGLRDRLRDAPLCDGRRVAVELGRLLRQAWQAWCATPIAENPGDRR